MHRDIKPGNVILAKDGRVKLADFGIARIESSVMTLVGTMLGTPAYMSPEQLMGAADRSAQRHLLGRRAAVSAPDRRSPVRRRADGDHAQGTEHYPAAPVGACRRRAGQP